jgi:hypothetical protein
MSPPPRYGATDLSKNGGNGMLLPRYSLSGLATVAKPQRAPDADRCGSMRSGVRWRQIWLSAAGVSP